MFRLLARVVTVLLLAGMMAAQQKPSAHAAPKPAVPPATHPALPTEETVDAFMKQMLGYQEGVSWKVAEIKPSEAEGLTEVDIVISTAQGSQSQRLYVTADGKHAMSGEIIPFGARPFEGDRQKLAKAATGPSRGPANAPVTIVEFSDLQCPHCKEEQPVIDKLLAEDANARLVFQHFPLPSHNWAAKAAAFADCVGQASGDAFWKFIEAVYTAQHDLTAANADEKLTGMADGAGVKGADMAACAARPETASRVERSVALGKSVDVNSTPTLFINGRRLPGGVPYEVVKKIVDFAATE